MAHWGKSRRRVAIVSAACGFIQAISIMVNPAEIAKRARRSPNSNESDRTKTIARC
jgi:hypothetical protein